MRINDIDISKYNRSLYRLNELAYKYGCNDILELDDNGPFGYSDTVHVVVARSMEDLRLEYLIKWERWRVIWKHHRENLSIEQLTVVIYNALAEFHQNYVDLMVPENYRDVNKINHIKSVIEKERYFIYLLTDGTGEIPEAYDCTIRPEDVARTGGKSNLDQVRTTLYKMGVVSINTTEDIDQILWRLAFMGCEITGGLRMALVELASNSKMIDYIDYKCHQYNHSIHRQILFEKKCNLVLGIEKIRKKL